MLDGCARASGDVACMHHPEAKLTLSSLAQTSAEVYSPGPPFPLSVALPKPEPSARKGAATQLGTLQLSLPPALLVTGLTALEPCA